MPPAGDVRAGRAFVELGTDASKLLKGLRAAMGRVRKFADDASGVGQRVALFGAGTAGSLVAITRGFRDAGAQLARMRDQTGLSAAALAGLARASADNEVPLETLHASLSALQERIGKGGPEVEAALGRIGLKLEDLRRAGLAGSISLIADGLAALPDEAGRVATSMALMSEGGVRLIPALLAGADGLNAAAQAAHEAGMAMDDDALDAAVALDNGFNALSASTAGLRNAVGGALAEAVIPLVNGLAEAVAGASRWVRENPEVIRTMLHTTTAVGALGAGVVGLAVAVKVLLSPLLLSVGLLAGIAAGGLAATDSLGRTQTGFGALFNSVRIGGQGLATQLAKTWERVSFGIVSFFDFIATGAQNAGRLVFAAMAWVPKKLLEAFRSLLDGMNRILQGMVQLWNDTVGQIAGELQSGQLSTTALDRWIAGLDARQQGFLDRAAQDQAATDARIRQRARLARETIAALNQADLSLIHI